MIQTHGVVSHCGNYSSIITMHLRLHVSYKININAGGAGQINGFLFSLILWRVQFISFREFALHCEFL